MAHVDTVQTGTYFGRVVLDEEIIFSPKLDDRLGVYTIMSLLPSLGIRMDVLLTDLEEVGRTTASDFKTDKEYNWIVEFDRCGTGAVSYQYDWGKKLDPYFGKLDHGSFSDISELGDLGVKALNVGVGYQDEHSARCYMSTWDYICNIARFIMMYQELKDTKFPHDESKVDQYRGYYGQMIDRGVLDKRLYDDSVPLAPDGTETAYWCPTCLEIKDIRTLWTEGGSRLCQSCGRETEKLYLPQ